MLLKLKKLNNKGVALITAYILLSTIAALSAGFALSSMTELDAAYRYQDSTRAFWLAEAGISQFIQDTTMLDEIDQTTLSFGNYTVQLAKDDTDATKRVVTATANVNGNQRRIQIEFPALPPDVFDNTMSSGGNINLTGAFAILNVHDKTRITGTFTRSNGSLVGWFEDKQEGVNASLTTLTYPDSNGNGTANEFGDFVEFNRDIIATYSDDEVVYVQNNGTVTILPNSAAYAGKKIIYVEGTTANSGDVNIIFDATWQNNQNLTVISTGKVTYLQPLQFASNSQLNTISWEGYAEPSVLFSTHSGISFTKGTAQLTEILAYSATTGSLIANQAVSANEFIAEKEFFYDDALTNEVVPPGFEGLVGQSAGGYSTTPNVWKET